MPYIDKTYYDETYKGMPITDPDLFDRLATRASDMIDQLTQYVLKGVEFTQFAQLIQDNVKKATAAQIEYMASLGGELAIHGGGPSSVNIGNFSYQAGSAGQQEVSPAVIKYLIPTGLLYKGVEVHGY
jgi:hypothetical protein